MLVTLPIAGLVLARLAENQFVRETERSLIAQGAIFAEVYRDALRAEGAVPLGPMISERAAGRLAEKYHPIEPNLAMEARQILDLAPDGYRQVHPPLPIYSRISERISTLARDAQKTTLAGYRFTDASGQVIASSGAGISRSLLHLPEVQQAFTGEVARVLRYREEQDERHTLSSISRDTGFRVHVVFPVVLEGRVAGIVYVSRAPLNLQKFLYNERALLGQMAAVTIIGAAILGFVFWRFVSRPIGGLRTQSYEVATGARPAPEPLAHYGVSELADLGQSVLSMAHTLTERSTALQTYTEHVTHELKSPVTSIVGAAEILETSGDDAERRARLLATIRAEALRMDSLLAKLRELAQVRTLTGEAETALASVLPPLKALFPGVDIEINIAADARLPMTSEALEMLLTQLIKNAEEHGAGRVTIDPAPGQVGFLLRDNGSGITMANRARIFEAFFTTKRDTGGTGMGLNIVAALVQQHGGTITLEDSDGGAAFRVTFP